MIPLQTLVVQFLPNYKHFRTLRAHTAESSPVVSQLRKKVRPLKGGVRPLGSRV